MPFSMRSNSNVQTSAVLGKLLGQTTSPWYDGLWDIRLHQARLLVGIQSWA